MTDNVIKGDNLEALFAVDRESAEEGKWFKIGAFAEMKIRRFNSKKSTKVRDALMAAHSPVRVTGMDVKLPEAVEEALNIEHIATGILVSWRGIVDKDGNELPYSKEAAITLLKKLPDLVSVIAQLSVSLQHWRDEDDATTKGN